MNDTKKTKELLLDEVAQLRRKIVELENAESERGRAEEALKAERDALQGLMDGLATTGIGVDVVSLDYKILHQNKLLIDAFGDLTGRRCYKSYMGLDAPCNPCPMVAATESGKVEQAEMTDSDGRAYEIMSAPLPSPDGVVNKAIEVVQDITERKRDEEVLMLFQSAMASSTDAVGMSTPDGRHWYQNEAFDRMFGEIGEDPPATLYVDQSVGREVFETIMAGKQWIGECRMHGADNKILDIFLRAYAAKDADGRVTNLIGVHTDITDQKQAEDALRESEELYRTTIDSFGEAVHLVDRDLCIVLFNERFRQWCDQLGIEQDIVGKPLQSVFPFLSNEVIGEYHHVFKTGQPTTTQEEREFGGQIFITEVQKIPVMIGGSTSSVLTIVADITERKRAEEALKNQRDRAQMYFDIAGIMFIALDKKGEVILANKKASEVLQAEVDEIVGKNWFQNFIPVDQRDEVFQVYNQLMRSEMEPVEYFVNDVVTQLGQQRTISWHNAILTDENGNIVGSLSSGEDITDQRRAEADKSKLEDQLHQSQKMEAVGRLAGGVAHDFNNLLTAINGYAEMVMDGLKPGDPMRTEMEEILSAGERAAGLTSQLLAFARKQIISPRMISPNEILENSQKMLRRIIGEDVDFAFMPGKELGSIKADPHQLDQILVNLAVNARDAMPHGGKLTIETQNVDLDEEFCKSHAEAEAGAYVMLAVSDTGHGMDAETKSMIFEPFFSTKSKDQGTGLGLATVYGIVKQNNGFISVYSEPGVITTFKVYFPRAAEEVDIPEEMKAPDLPTGTETVLLVEDEAVVRRLAKKVLEKLGYKVIEAPDGGEALLTCKIHSDKIDLLLTDVIMPTMNGRELQDKLLEIKPDLKALFMSGYTENVIAHHGVLDEGTHFIQKPFNKTTLAQKVRQALDS